MVPNKRFFVYLERKLGANKRFWMRRRRRGRRRKKMLKYYFHCNFCGYKQKKQGANKQFLFILLAFISTIYLAFINAYFLLFININITMFINDHLWAHFNDFWSPPKMVATFKFLNCLIEHFLAWAFSVCANQVKQFLFFLCL